jgi:hypothetical protein
MEFERGTRQSVGGASKKYSCPTAELILAIFD